MSRKSGFKLQQERAALLDLPSPLNTTVTGRGRHRHGEGVIIQHQQFKAGRATREYWQKKGRGTSLGDAAGVLAGYHAATVRLGVSMARGVGGASMVVGE